jgi:hypothetical protein
MTLKQMLQTLGFLIVMAIFVMASIEESEWSRIYDNARKGSHPPEAAVDANQLAIDLATFLSPPVASREVGSEGNRRAQSYITSRYAQIGLLGFTDSYALPFSFTRTDVAGLVKPGAHWKTEYPAATNLAGYLRGTHFPERYIVVSARYDTHAETGKFGPDQWKANESGLAAMLAMASYFAQHPPRNSIVFVAFDAEELGQAGARAFVDHPPMARERIALNLNLDIVSSDNPHYFFVAGTAYTPRLKPFVEQAAYSSSRPVGIGHDRPFWRAMRIEDWTGASDHRVFHEAGIAFLFASIEESDEAHNVKQTPPHTVERVQDAANFLTVLAVKLDAELDAIPTEHVGTLF